MHNAEDDVLTDGAMKPVALSGLRTLVAQLQPIVFGLMFVGLFYAITTANASRGISYMPEQAWAVLVVLAIGTGVTLLTAPFLKRVRITHNALLASNYLREIRIPFEEVTDVTNEGCVFGPAIRIHLARRTRFGTSILFLPKRPSWLRSSSGIMAEDVLALMEEAPVTDTID